MSYSITEDDYFQKQQPAKSEELVNIVECSSLPLEIQDWKDAHYKSREPITFTASQTQTIEIKYSGIPVKGAEATAYITDIAGTLNKDSTTGKYTNSTMTCVPSYYAWGARLAITNPDAAVRYCVVVVGAYPMKVEGKKTEQSRDAASILENGELKFSVQDNHLIQSSVLAKEITDTLLDTYKTPRKDINLNWRGNMAIELQDEIVVPEYNKNGITTNGTFAIYKQKTEYDGSVKQNTEGRKITPTYSATTTTTAAPTTTGAP